MEGGIDRGWQVKRITAFEEQRQHIMSFINFQTNPEALGTAMKMLDGPIVQQTIIKHTVRSNYSFCDIHSYSEAYSHLSFNNILVFKWNA